VFAIAWSLKTKTKVSGIAIICTNTFMIT
jgi:hypothetical protein